MNKNQKIQKAKIIQKDIDFWFKSIKQSIDISTLSKSNKWILRCIPKYIKIIDNQLAKAEKLGIDELLDLQSIHNDITKYTKIYDETIKEDN